jgi:hypothetical protein
MSQIITVIKQSRVHYTVVDMRNNLLGCLVDRTDLDHFTGWMFISKNDNFITLNVDRDELLRRVTDAVKIVDLVRVNLYDDTTSTGIHLQFS